MVERWNLESEVTVVEVFKIREGALEHPGLKRILETSVQCPESTEFPYSVF